jgi:hypothetical protein
MGVVGHMEKEGGAYVVPVRFNDMVTLSAMRIAD